MSRYFNTSGPCFPDKHYMLMRPELVAEGMEWVKSDRYFTIWAPRQTGKSTYFLLLKEQLQKEGYKVINISAERFGDASKSLFLNRLSREFKILTNSSPKYPSFGAWAERIEKIKDEKCVFIIDEIERLNEDLFGDFLHTLRDLYHNRDAHCLKSVILVGVSNIVGVVEDNASPFNVSDNISIPYFTDKETYQLLGQHEAETGQLFAEDVKLKVSEITANQPGLVNAFADKLTVDYSDKEVIEYEDYLKVEDWFIYQAIHKNIANIINKARRYRSFLEQLLFKEVRIAFDIDREAIKLLHTNGIIKRGEDGNVAFWVPLYKKRLYKTFYPYTNGEKERISKNLWIPDFLKENGKFNLEKIIANYKEYAQRRSFKYFREKDKKGNYLSIKEAALMYSFETYIQAFLQEAKGKSYIEAHTGLGRTDILIYLKEEEYVIETKVYYSFNQFEEGKTQLAYYCNKLGLSEGYYLVFISNTVKKRKEVSEITEIKEGVAIHTFLVWYDEDKDF